MKRPVPGQAGRGCLIALLAVLAAALLANALAVLLLALALALVASMLAALLLPEYRHLWQSQIRLWLAEAASCFNRILREQAKTGTDAEHPGDAGPDSQEVPHD